MIDKLKNLEGAGRLISWTYVAELCKGGQRAELCRPCDCGCDFREGNYGVGYFIESNTDWVTGGRTLWFKTEESFQAAKAMLTQGERN